MNPKLPGLSMQTVATELDLTYHRRISLEAYESLILNALKGDHSNLFRRQGPTHHRVWLLDSFVKA